MGDAPPLDEDAPDEALLAEDGRSSPTSVGRVRKRAQIGAQLARGWERGATPLRRRLARSCCCLQTRSGSTSARLRGWGGETMLAGTRIPHHPHVRAHHAAIPPHSQAPSPSDAATPSGGLADDERDEAAAPPGWPARASRWPVQRGGTGSPILARALADARRSRERAKCGKMGLFCHILPTLHGDLTSERVGSTTRRLHQRVRLAILYRIDTWYVLSIARGEELRPFSTCVQRR